MPTARKRLRALTALVGAMRMAAIVLLNANHKKIQKGESRASRRHVLTCIIGSWLWGSGYCGQASAAGLEQIRYTAEPSGSMINLPTQLQSWRRHRQQETSSESYKPAFFPAILPLSLFMIATARSISRGIADPTIWPSHLAETSSGKLSR